MGLLPSITEGLAAATVTGLLGIVTWYLTKRSERPAKRDAWQKNAEALRNELRSVYTAQIGDLQSQVAAADRAIERKDAEISRLNKLLNRQQRGGGSNE